MLNVCSLEGSVLSTGWGEQWEASEEGDEQVSSVGVVQSTEEMCTQVIRKEPGLEGLEARTGEGWGCKGKGCVVGSTGCKLAMCPGSRWITLGL